MPDYNFSIHRPDIPFNTEPKETLFEKLTSSVMSSIKLYSPFEMRGVTRVNIVNFSLDIEHHKILLWFNTPAADPEDIFEIAKRMEEFVQAKYATKTYVHPYTVRYKTCDGKGYVYSGIWTYDNNYDGSKIISCRNSVGKYYFCYCKETPLAVMLKSIDYNSSIINVRVSGKIDDTVEDRCILADVMDRILEEEEEVGAYVSPYCILAYPENEEVIKKYGTHYGIYVHKSDVDELIRKTSKK